MTVLSAALSAIMIMASRDILAGTMSVGDLVGLVMLRSPYRPNALSRSWSTVFSSNCPSLSDSWAQSTGK